MMPPYYCSTMLSTYDIHNEISFWGHSEAIDFWPYVLAFKAAVPKILWSKELVFFSKKASLYISMTPQNAGVDRQTLFAQAPPYSGVIRTTLTFLNFIKIEIMMVLY